MTRRTPFARYALGILCVLAAVSCRDDAPETKPPAPSATRAAARISETALTAHFLRIRIAADRYRALEGGFPTSVDQLTDKGLLHKGQELDPWGNPYVLRREGDGLTVISYGADGAPGGAGPDADRVSSAGPDLR